jgi:hypothetical protein
MESFYGELRESIKTSRLANGMLLCLILGAISTFVSAGFCFKHSAGEACATFYVFVPIAFAVLFVIVYAYLRISCEKKEVVPQEPPKITVLVDNPMLETPPSPKRTLPPEPPKITVLVDNPMLETTPPKRKKKPKSHVKA